MGAGGRDFHVFLTLCRDDPSVQVVAFTAEQIPNIHKRRFPSELAGASYPEGIPIHPESELEDLIKRESVDEVIFAYSDVSYDYIAQREALVEKAGARFRLHDPVTSQIPTTRPVISICAVRTGCGKSPTTRRVSEILQELGHRLAIIRHPMPYGQLIQQEVQKFDSLDDLERANCTVEEMEEYEPHLRRGFSVYAGVDYRKILERAEAEADLLLWDGGNNDLPFYQSALRIVVVDPLRPGHEITYYPGRLNFERADVLLFSKMNAAREEDVQQILRSKERLNPDALVVYADCPIHVPDPEAIRGKRVLVIEDGPTVTHGDLPTGAGYAAAIEHGAAEVVDPRSFAVGSIGEAFERYPGTGPVLPALGYGGEQLQDLEETIRKVNADLVLIATPVDLTRILRIEGPSQRVTYELTSRSQPGLSEILREKFPEPSVTASAPPSPT